MAKRFRFTKVREVKTPFRAHEGDAGLDFFMPTDLTLADIFKANAAAKDISHTAGQVNPGQYTVVMSDGKIKQLILGPLTRILIPSGIRCLLEPVDSMMQVNNKSGRSTKKGLLFTAQVCDSPYTGEYHLGVFNTSSQPQTLVAGEPVVQLVHVPIILDDELIELSNEDYEKEAETWGTRGTDGLGSGDKKEA